MTDTARTPTFRTAAAQLRRAETLFRGLFERAPLPLLVLTPSLRIVDTNDAYLIATGRRRDTLAGLDMFEAFPDSPHDPCADGVRNLGASFERVLRTGDRDLMRLQRYDVRPDDRPWEVRYWHPANWAVRDEAGAVMALVHHVQDATASVLATRSAAAREGPVLLDPIERADAAIRRAQTMREQVQRDLAEARYRMPAALKRPD